MGHSNRWGESRSPIPDRANFTLLDEQPVWKLAVGSWELTIGKPMDSDEALMLAVRGGSRPAFETLFDRHRDAIWRFYRRRIDDPGRAEELVQDVFLAILQRAKRHEPRAAFRTYLFGIAYNVLMADRRSAVRHQADPLTLWMALGTGSKRTLKTGVHSTTGVASARGAQEPQIGGAIEGQPAAYKERLESARPKEGVHELAATNAQQPASAPTNRTQKIIRTVSMTIIAKEFETVRETLDRLLRDVGGFVGTMQASDVRNERSVSATLGVPASRLDETVRSLRTLGDVVNESQSGEDVTEQVRDIEARLKNSRNTEQRLTDVLRNRTGRVADILEVEREIARVREEIERRTRNA